MVLHGVGLCDEYPAIYYPQDQAAIGYDHTLEPGMILSVESYVGVVGGREGVKLEQMILLTEDGVEDLTSYPFDERLVG